MASAFLNNFEIIEPLTGGAVQTLLARQKRTGRQVLVHRFPDPGDASHRTLWKEALRRLLNPEGFKVEVLDWADESTVCYLATSDSPECRQLGAWLQGQALRPPGAPAGVSPPPALPEEKTQDSIALPFALTPEAARRAAPAETSKPEIPKTAPRIEEPASGPGEFTRLFQSAFAGKDFSPESPTDPVMSAPEIAKPRAEGASFTGLFGAKAETPQAASKPSVPAATPESGEEMGEFTRMFSMPSQPAAKAAAPPPAPAAKAEPPKPAPPPAAPTAAPAEEPGEFTQMFQGMSPPPATPGAPAAAPPAPAAKTPPPPPAPLAPQEGPGEFTQMFSQPGTTPARPASSSALPAPPQQGPAFTPPFRPTRTIVRPVNVGKTPPAPAPEIQDEFERLFGKASGGESRGQAPPPGPGEFTQMFQGAGVSPGPPPMSGTPPAKGPASSEPGEFTKLFSQPQFGSTPSAPPSTGAAAPSGPLSASSLPGQKQAGDFTRIFESQPSAPGQSGRGPGEKPAGEFTRMFGSPSGKGPAPASQPEPIGGGQTGPSGATGVFSSTQASKPSNVVLPEGPSDYTRLLQSSGPAGAAAGEPVGGGAQPAGAQPGLTGGMAPPAGFQPPAAPQVSAPAPPNLQAPPVAGPMRPGAPAWLVVAVILIGLIAVVLLILVLLRR